MTDRQIRFEILATHGRARKGQLHTARGVVDTPVFMPIGTRGPVKLLTPAQVAATGAQIVLANTYHLIVHPGVVTVEALGGLNRFTGWPGPILTDSGGYQVFSLAHTRTIDDDGVSFASPRTGERLRFTPRETVEWQRRMGSTFIMQLDECPPWPCSHDDAERSVRRSLAWAAAGREVPLGPGQALLPIVQGSTFADLRERSARGLVELDTDAIAIGGLSVGEKAETMFGVLDLLDPLLPRDKPRYLMGVGKPEDIVAAVARGVDMFDCVLPTRNARHALAFTSQGLVRLRNARHARDSSPLDAACDCYTCGGGPGFSRGYLRHLTMIDEPTGQVLLSIHNLRYYQTLMRRLRAAIAAGDDLESVLPPRSE